MGKDIDPLNPAPSEESDGTGWEEAMSSVIDAEFAEDEEDDRLAAETAITAAFGVLSSDSRTEPVAPSYLPEEAMIIQPAPTGESTPLINLESMKSGISAHDGVGEDNDDLVQCGSSPWLNVASSSSSKGSQGSYADQVPELSKSGSIAEEVPPSVVPAPLVQGGVAIEAKRSDLGSPWTLPGSDKSSPTPSDDGEHGPKALDAAPPLEDENVRVVKSVLSTKSSDAPDDELAHYTRDSPAANTAANDEHTAYSTTTSHLPSYASGSRLETKASKDSQDVKESSSVLSNVSDMISQFTDPKKSMDDLDDILGPKGALTKSFSKSPSSDVAGIFSERTGFERTGNVVANATQKPKSDDPALLAASQKELEALTNTKSKRPAPLEIPEPSQAESRQSKAPPPSPLELIVASLETHQAKQTRPPLKVGETPGDTPSSRRQFIGPTGSQVSHNSTFESGTSFRTSASNTPVSAISKESEEGGSFWSSSRNDTMSPGGTTLSRGDTGTLSHGGSTMSRGDTLSPGGSTVTGGETLSPGGTSVASRGDTLSPGGTSVSRGDTLSRGGSSGSRGDTLSPGGTSDSRGDTLSPGGSSVSRGDTFGSGETSVGDTLSPGSYGSRGETISPSTRGGMFSPASSAFGTGLLSPAETEKTASRKPPMETPSRISEGLSCGTGEVSEASQGGRLWEMATLEASKSQDRPMSPEASRFAESIMARTRSRAEPDAVVSNSTSLERAASDRPTMIRIGEQQDEVFILNTALARKRVRVVQLLIVGLVTLLVGFLGNLWVQSSCHFVSASVQVGENEQVFDLHYGLWKYTPIDSAFQGYSYCYQYDDEYTADAPFFARWASCVAVFGGAFSLGVLWFYLIFGRGNQMMWNYAVAAAGISGALQLCTLFILAGPVCERSDCTLGPAGILSVIASMVYFILAFEMHYNTPMAAWVTQLAECPSTEQPGHLMANLEMTDFEDGAKAYVRRIVRGDSSPYPTLNQFQRDNASPIGEAMLDRGYKPPAQIV